MNIDQRSGIGRILPILHWLPRYQPAWLSADLLAGLVAAAVVIPQAMAYASIAGLPLQVGLYVALAPMLVYVFFGTSRPLSVSSTSTISMLTATVLAGVVQSGDPNDYIIPAVTLAFLAGVFLLLAGLFRLGVVANFISLPVLVGFKAGIGVVIFVGQLGKVLGISVEKGPILQTIFYLLRNLEQAHLQTLILSLATLAVLLLLPRFTPRLPVALLAVAGGILAAALLNLEASGVALVGEIPPGLPRFSIPDWSLVGGLWPGALGIALMSFVESIASARAFAKQDDPPVDADQELIALGLANIAGAFTQAYPAGGGTSQTAVNDQAGAKSQVAQVITAGVVVITLLFLAPLISLMPAATLGVLVLVAAAGLVKIGEFRRIARLRTTEFSWAIITAVGVIVLGTLQGILVAVAASVVNLLYLANHPPVYLLGRKSGTDVFRPLDQHPQDETLPGLVMLRTEGMLYFASAPRAFDRLRDHIRQADPKVIVLECSAIPNIEYTALDQMTKFEAKLADHGVTLWLAALNPVPLELIEKSALGKRLTHERMFFNLEQAFEAYQVLQSNIPVDELDPPTGGGPE